MARIDKVQFSSDSGFDLEAAIELSNLIAVAYDDYEVWDERVDKDPNQLPKIIKGSKAFIKLPVDDLEEVKQKEIDKPAREYGRLDQFWQKTNKVETYERLDNFWFPEWWWGGLLKRKNILKLFRTNIKDIFQGIEDLAEDEQLFGFIAKSQTYENRFFVVFRGTREAAEWFNNFRPVAKPFLQEQYKDLGEVRNGFNLIYTAQRDNEFNPFNKNKELKNLPMQGMVDKFFKEQNINDSSQILVTGHSLGAGLATLAALHLCKIAESMGVKPLIQLYTFASPRVGNETFAEHFDTDGITSFRIINSEDLIQTVPLPTTQVADDETLQGMSKVKQARFRSFRALLEVVTGGQTVKRYQHVGVPITFTKQTRTIAGNHNLTKTYREALNL